MIRSRKHTRSPKYNVKMTSPNACHSQSWRREAHVYYARTSEPFFREVAAVEDERDKQKKLLNDKRRVRFNKGTNDESATEDSAADVTTEFGDVEVDGTKPTPGTEEDARDVFTATLSKGLDSIQSASLATAEEVSSLWDQNSVTNCTQSIMTMLNVDAEK